MSTNLELFDGIEFEDDEFISEETVEELSNGGEGDEVADE